AAGAVNTISFAAGRLRGDNTDGVGLIRDLTTNQHVTLTGRRMLVLGAGGAARGIVGALPPPRPAQPVTAKLAPFDLLLNATSAGLNGEPPPFPGSIVGPDSIAYDLVYSMHDTPFVAWARTNGAARALQGWGMLVEQAAESFFIWRGVRPDTRPILQQLAH